MEEKELWMNKLKEKLEDYSEPIPASGWEQLEKELMPPVERKIYPYRKWMMAAAAVILLALVSSVSLYFWVRLPLTKYVILKPLHWLPYRTHCLRCNSRMRKVQRQILCRVLC